MDRARFAAEFALFIGGQPVPADLRASIQAVRCHTGYEGLDELAFVLTSLADLPTGTIVADLSIARGLDYYTGSVYEGKFARWPNFGSICSGGRYENLASSFIRRNLPGIGMSIGVTRIFAKLVAEGLIQTGPKSPTHVLVVIPSAERRFEAVATAASSVGAA